MTPWQRQDCVTLPPRPRPKPRPKPKRCPDRQARLCATSTTATAACFRLAAGAGSFRLLRAAPRVSRTSLPDLAPAAGQSASRSRCGMNSDRAARSPAFTASKSGTKTRRRHPCPQGQHRMHGSARVTATGPPHPARHRCHPKDRRPGSSRPDTTARSPSWSGHRPAARRGMETGRQVFQTLPPQERKRS